MREIKFRGWNTKHKKRIYGDLFRSRGQWFITQDGIVTNPLAEPEDRRVEPETVGQSTGLFDKNGKEIYEGDILAYDGKSSGWHHKPGIVYYDLPNQQYRLAIADCNNETLKAVVKAMDNSKSFSSYRMEAKHRVIIGNIHENPELINK